jgi:hypothetical protein
MLIALRPDTEAKLRQRAGEGGGELSELANELLDAVLDWEALDRAEAIAGVRRGLTSSDAGRVRPASEVLDRLEALLVASER